MPKRIPILLAIATFTVASAGSVSAQSVTEIKGAATVKRSEMPKQQAGMRKMMVMPGDVAKENVQKVNSEIRWHSNLNSALGQAHRQNKMVLWVHLIGNLSGAT